MITTFILVAYSLYYASFKKDTNAITNKTPECKSFCPCIHPT